MKILLNILNIIFYPNKRKKNMYCFQKFKSGIVLNKYIKKIVIYKTFLNNFYTYNYLTFAKI